MIPVTNRATAAIHATTMLVWRNQKANEDKLTLINIYKTLKRPLPINPPKNGMCLITILTLSYAPIIQNPNNLIFYKHTLQKMGKVWEKLRMLSSLKYWWLRKLRSRQGQFFAYYNRYPVSMLVILKAIAIPSIPIVRFNIIDTLIINTIWYNNTKLNRMLVILFKLK